MARKKKEKLSLLKRGYSELKIFFEILKMVEGSCRFLHKVVIFIGMAAIAAKSYFFPDAPEHKSEPGTCPPSPPIHKVEPANRSGQKESREKSDNATTSPVFQVVSHDDHGRSRPTRQKTR